MPVHTACNPECNPANPILAVFSTRSPHRPNPIGVHPVRIRAVVGTRIEVGPLEAVNGTPVLDIKPLLERDTTTALVPRSSGCNGTRVATVDRTVAGPTTPTKEAT